MGKNGLKMGVWLRFYKFSENREVFQGRFLPYKLGIDTPCKGCLPQSPANKADDAHPLQMLHLMSTVEATWKSTRPEPTTTSRRR